MLTAALAKHRDRHVSQSSLQSLNSFSSASALSTSSIGATSLRPYARSSTSTVDSQPLNYENFSRHVPTSFLGQRLPQPYGNPFEEGTSPTSTPACIYWCTICEEPRRFKTSGGWIKHEKEVHEGTIYVCMPDGATEVTKHGTICRLCGKANPSENHMNEHDVLPCLRKPPSARTYNRGYQFEKHLIDSHRLRKGSAVVKQWRRQCEKQAWACGFCAAYFAKSSSRFRHIATEHYERGEDLSNWDLSKVILGLLQQPKVHKAWTERIKLESSNRGTDIRWDNPSAGNLIIMLELGPSGTDNGATLANAAFVDSDYYRNRLGSLPIATPTAPSSKTTHRSSQTRLGARDGAQLAANNPASLGRPEKMPSMSGNLVPHSGWFQDTSDCLSKIAFGKRIRPKDTAFSKPPSAATSQMRPSRCVHAKMNPEFHASGNHPIFDDELRWSGQIATQPSYVSHSGDNADFSWPDTTINGIGYMGSNSTTLPVEPQADSTLANANSTISATAVMHGFSSEVSDANHDRSVSPMDRDLDLVTETNFFEQELNLISQVNRP